MSVSARVTEEIENFLIRITESEEYLSQEYLIFSIRKLYLHYLSGTRVKDFEIPLYLKELVKYVNEKFDESKILANDMLEYMLDNDINNWVHYYDFTFLRPLSINSSSRGIKCDGSLFILILTGYILDCFREKKIDIQQIVNKEKLLHETNQYGLSIVNGVEFKRDYFVFEDKAYLYNILTDKQEIDFGDSMPGFARIITEQITTGNVLLRLDERLALPVSQAISYSTLNFEKFYGPQFHFKDSVFEKQKTIIVHIDNETCDKLLMVIKQDYDFKQGQPFLHIEIETLPYVKDDSQSTHCITTFLHGMYYLDSDCFTHIDYTKNQYQFDDYVKKYAESTSGVPIDFYAKKELHYKIWCVENGNYSKEVWYNLMIVSLTEKYRTLLDEILA